MVPISICFDQPTHRATFTRERSTDNRTKRDIPRGWPQHLIPRGANRQRQQQQQALFA